MSINLKKHIKRLLFSLIILCFTASNNFAQMFTIGLFYGKDISAVSVVQVTGEYEIFADSTSVEFNKDDIIHVTALQDHVQLKNQHKIIGQFNKIKIIGFLQDNTFKIKPTSPGYNGRVYDDNLFLSATESKLKIINEVDLEKYIAGVVESEGGPKAHNEYYKTQAILCRTYALNHFDRHILDGYNLCDGVHCQAYYAHCHKNTDIKLAASSTKGLVLVDTSLNLISSSFHSNSGGQTANSEDVWLKPLSYLRSVPDSFSLSGRNAFWTKKIPIWKWRQYLINNGIKVDYPGYTHDDLQFWQPNRKRNYEFNGDSIPLKTIRIDWKLRSAFFSLVREGNQLVFKGKGYGHGVGLSQEGAMIMAQMNMNYRDIIMFYYKNIHIVSLRALDFFREVFKLDEEPDSLKTNTPPPIPPENKYSIEEQIKQAPGL